MTAAEACICPQCECCHSRVIETRWTTIRGQKVRVRVRRCRHCHRQYRTKEITDPEITLPTNHRAKKYVIRHAEAEAEAAEPTMYSPRLPKTG